MRQYSFVTVTKHREVALVLKSEDKFKDAHDAFVRSMKLSAQRKRRKVITIVAAIVAVIVAYLIISIWIKHSKEIDAAKSSLKQLDITYTSNEAEFKPEEDWDLDGVKNGDEKDGGTNIQNEDTDGDGISDGDELKLGTDPLKEDTDGDGILDGYELIAGLDPLKEKSDGSTEDSKREMTIEKKSGEVTLTLNGTANNAEVSVEELGIVGISTNTSVISRTYSVYSDRAMDKATISFKVNSDMIKNMDLSLSDLSVMKFDVDNKTYTKLESTADEKNSSVSAEIRAVGTYVLGIEKTINLKSVTRVCFLIDNSGSMYPESMCAGSTENDVDFKRLTFAQSLIGRFEDGCEVGISKYTGTYTKLLGFTTDKKAMGDALSRIKNEKEVFNGTHSQTALKNCINEFKDKNGVKYSNIIVMLTDGESDEVGGEAIEELIKQANKKNIIILTVGLGRDVDRAWLQKLASETRGKHYAASDANALDDVYKSIVTTLNYDIVSYSGKDDFKGYSLYNTGFEPKKNGFAFKNFRVFTTNSVDFGMAVMARDWYTGDVSLKLDDIDPADESEQKVKAEGYDLTDTTFGKKYESRKELHSIYDDLFGGKYTDVTKYLDYSSKGKKLDIDDDCYSDATSKGWAVKNMPVSGSNLKWNSVDFLALDIANQYNKIEKGYSKDSAEFAKALYRLNALQWDDSNEEYKLSEEGFEKLEKQLSMGIPAVVTIDGTHTVNAIGLIQDSICHRKFILQVYDNNYPDEKKELYIEKRLICKLNTTGNKATVESTDFAYSARYEGKLVGVSFTDVKEH